MSRVDVIEAAAQEVWRSESVNRRVGLEWPDDLSASLVTGYRTAAVNILHMSAFTVEGERDPWSGVMHIWSKWMNDELTHEKAMELIAKEIEGMKNET